jgi:hypothetical protein
MLTPGRIGPRGRSTLVRASESGAMFQAVPVRVEDHGTRLAITWCVDNLGNTEYEFAPDDAVRVILPDGRVVEPQPVGDSFVLGPDDDARFTTVFEMPAGVAPACLEVDVPTFGFPGPFRWEFGEDEA